ncbi:energy transducer TonB [bacterium]|nr:energy transducer TonB [bacterium]
MSFAQDVEDSTESSASVYNIYEVHDIPMFNGEPMENELRIFISNNINYPDSAMKYETQGVVVLTFIVKPDSTVSQVTVITPPKGNGLEEESIRVLESTSGLWTPAMISGKPVAVRLQIPINFKLF